MEKIYQFFKSKKLAIVLLLILAIISIVGTFLFNKDISQQELSSSDPATWLSYLEIGQFYHSPVFILCLIFLAINLAVCTYDRFKTSWKKLIKVSYEVGDEYIKSLPFYYVLTVGAGLKPAPTILLERGLLENKFKIYKAEGLVYGEKGRINIWGTYITHIALLMVLIAGTISGLYGFVGTIGIFEGMESSRYYNWTEGKYVDLPFIIHVEKLNVSYYPPLIEMEIGARNNKKKYVLKKGDEIFYQDGGQSHRIVFAEFVPDSMVMNNEVYIISESLHSPAVLFKIYQGERFISNYWIFAENTGHKNKIELPYNLKILKSRYLVKHNESIISIIEDGKVKLKDVVRTNKPVPYGKLKIYFWGFGQDNYRNYWTGLQISYDPGVLIMWIGLGGVLVGLFIIFFIRYDRIWIRLSGEKVLLGGKTTGDEDQFRKKIEMLIFHKSNET